MLAEPLVPLFTHIKSAHVSNCSQSALLLIHIAVQRQNRGPVIKETDKQTRKPPINFKETNGNC